MIRFKLAAYAFALALTVCSGARAEAPPKAIATRASMPATQPEKLGFSVGGLEAFRKQMHELVDSGRLAGVSVLVARHGTPVLVDVHGQQDLESGTALRYDSIFRIASMTKPVTGVAMMILYEEGKWRLDDPVSKHIPEFADLKVRNSDGVLVKPSRPMTMAQLMSHTAGFAPDPAYDALEFKKANLQAMIDKLSRLPLASEPGADFAYGVTPSIRGYLVEKLSGQSLDQFFKSRIFEPLKMPDTGFWVEPGKLPRAVRASIYDKEGKLIPAQGGPVDIPTSKPVFLNGAGGLVSTLPDYWRFAQMLANDGQLDGVRILKPETVLLMRQNQLEAGVKFDLFGPAVEGMGFGMDFGLVLNPDLLKTPQGKGTFSWGGRWGTWFWIDPTVDLVVVGMIQNVNGFHPASGTPQMGVITPPGIYAALVDRSR